MVKYLYIIVVLLSSNIYADSSLGNVEQTLSVMNEKLDLILQQTADGTVTPAPTPIPEGDLYPTLEYKKGQALRAFGVGINTQKLYSNCNNIVDIKLPQLNRNNYLYDLHLRAMSGEVSPYMESKTKFSIIPNSGDLFRLNISAAVKTDDGIKRYGMNPILFNVIEPPRPVVRFYVNGKLYNGVTLINNKSRLQIKIIANQYFKTSMPEDSKYMVDSVDLLAQRSLGAPSKIGSYSGAGIDQEDGYVIDLQNKLSGDAPGTKVFLRLNNIYRVNSKQQKILVKFEERDLILGFAIK